MIKDSIKQLIRVALNELQKQKGFGGFELPEILLEHPENPEHGDYSTNIAFALAKQLGKRPQEIAEAIKSKIQSSKPKTIERVEALGGFVNFYLPQETVLGEFGKVLKQKEKYGANKEGKGKTIVIDYSSPNIAKSFGIGHLRSTIIGRALYNIYEFLGWRTVGINHLGDWGTQFGALIYQIRKENLTGKPLTVQDLEQLYVKFYRDAKLKPELKKEARLLSEKLEQGDKEVRHIWNYCKKVSLQEFQRIYDFLGVKFNSKYNYIKGESEYASETDEILQLARQAGIVEKSQGAWVLKVGGFSSTVFAKIDQTSGGIFSIYILRDLAALRDRIKRWHPDLIIYETGSEQILHFRQLAEAAQKLGWIKENQIKHVFHGLYRTKAGKFSTRKGQTIHLEEVLNEAIERAQKLSPDKKIAKAVGIGAVKYNDLSQHPAGDIVFDWDKILNLKGNSAPYLQYTYARCKSILRKAPASVRHLADYGEAKQNNLSKEELDILRTMYKFPEVVQEAAEKYAPSLICNFAFELAKLYNNFYNTHPVLQADTKEQKEFRLRLTSAVAQLIQNSLSLLGIQTLDRM